MSFPGMLKKMAAKLVHGFLILLPFLVTYLMLGQLFDLFMALTAPVADLLPPRLFQEEWGHQIAAVLLLVLAFVLVGLSANTRTAKRIGNWFERVFLGKFPPYTVLKSLTTRIGGKDVPGEFQPALLTVSPGVSMVVAVVEELPDGRLTVFVPMSPTPGVGVLQIVDPDRVERMETPMSDVLGWHLNWGLGTEQVLKPQKP